MGGPVEPAAAPGAIRAGAVTAGATPCRPGCRVRPAAQPEPRPQLRGPPRAPLRKPQPRPRVRAGPPSLAAQPVRADPVPGAVADAGAARTPRGIPEDAH